MELLQRKPNRVLEYDYSQNGAYFVTLCTQNRKNILSQIVGDDASSNLRSGIKQKARSAERA